MRYAISIFLLFLSILAWPGNRTERRDTLKVDVSLDASIGTNSSIKPLWSYSQEWGRYTQYDRNEALAYAKVQYGWTNRKGWFDVKGGIAGQWSTDGACRMLSEAYVSGKIWKIDFTFGREARTPISQHDNLGMGTYLMTNNARPTTRAGLGIFDYWAIPGIRNWIEIKGGLYVGKMPDGDSDLYTKKALLHEKFAYLRIGHFPVKPYLGLVHSVIMGGTMADGTVIPIDFWASFFGKGSKKLLDAGFIGEYYNACGGHQGLWDLGVDFDFDDFSASIYYQRPFYDAAAMYLEDFGTCKDFHLGFDLNLKKSKYVKRLNFEYLTTVWQGGLGLQDPIFISTGPERTGEVIQMAILQVTTDDLRKYFAPGMIQEWEAEHGPLKDSHISDFLIKYANKGRPWGNRSRYLYNDVYPQGWTNGGLSMGYPVFQTDVTTNAVSEEYGLYSRFSSIRMTALNFGVSGELSPRLSYKAKVTYIDNYGNLNDQYWYDVPNADFVEYDNYYYSGGKTEVYTGLWLDYRFRFLTFSGSLAWDFGQMYNSFAARLGVKIALDCIPFRK